MLNDNCVDRSGGIFYNQYDRNRVESTWKDRLRAEQELRLSNTKRQGFQMNLANQCGTSGLLRLKFSHNRQEYVTEKEHLQSPDARRSIKGMDPNSFEVLAIKHLDKKPPHKWDLPNISSHEYGWMQGDFCRAETLSPSKTASAGFFGHSGQSPTATRAASTSASSSKYAGSHAAASLSSAGSSKPQSVVMVANDHILRRIQSAPHLPTGPRPPEAKELNNVKWRRPQRSCDVTNYVEIYQASLKHNPFNQAAAGR